MKIAVYSTRQYERKYLQQVNENYGFEFEFFDFLLSEATAKTLRDVKVSVSSSTMMPAAAC